MPKPAPPDPFLEKLCIVGFLAGLPLLLIARPVGVIVMVAFGIWWMIIQGTENMRREMARKSLKEAYEFECERMDEEYAELCRPIEEANKKLTDAWEASYAAVMADHEKLCRDVDERNRRQLAAFLAAQVARNAEYERACQEIEAANRVVLNAWESEDAARTAVYDSARRQIESANQGLIDAWEALRASRKAEHERACLEIDSKNRRLIAAWEAANAPWVAEEKQWRDRVASAEAEVLRLEAEFNRQRAAAESRFRQRKDEALVIAASHDRAKFDYERELKQAEINSKTIQLEEYLDKALIRQAKLKGITGDRIMSLESFGIETAKDVPLLNSQKVPGIGPVLSKRLFDWRNSLLASFRPQNTLPDSEKNRIASRYAPVMLPLAQSIQVAINDLDAIANSHRTREAETIKAVAAAVQNLAIADAHVKAMRIT
jgi:hypothetical protein